MSIYLDNAATTKVKREVLEVMMPYFTDMWYNPSSLYGKSVEVKNKIDEAKSVIASFIGAKQNEIYFTSSGSESNCWAIRGFVDKCVSKRKMPIVLTSTIEHKSIMDCVENIDADVYFISVDKYGLVNVDELESTLKSIYGVIDNDLLVSIQFANNEIGSIQDIKMISDIVHKYGGILHTDAVQAFGNMSIDVDKLGIDMMTVSGHKIGCPKGIAFLYVKEGIDVCPLIYGSQMNGMRGGSENTPYIVGMAKAVQLLDFRVKSYATRDYFIDRLVKEFGCKLNGVYTNRLANNINVTFPQNITGESLLYILDMSDIQIGTGSACNSKSVEPSHVLKAIGLSDEEAMKTVRFTLSSDITCLDIDNVITEINKAIAII